MVVLPSRVDLVAQGCRQRVDQAALDAGCGDHELALLAHHLAVRVARSDGDRDQRFARVAAAEMRAPVDIESAVRRAAAAPPPPPSPAAAAPRRRRSRAAPSCRRRAPGSPRRPALRLSPSGVAKQQLVAAPAQPAMAHVELHARLRAAGAATRAAAAPPSYRSGTRGPSCRQRSRRPAHGSSRAPPRHRSASSQRATSRSRPP